MKVIESKTRHWPQLLDKRKSFTGTIIDVDKYMVCFVDGVDHNPYGVSFITPDTFSWELDGIPIHETPINKRERNKIFKRLRNSKDYRLIE